MPSREADDPAMCRFLLDALEDPAVLPAEPRGGEDGVGLGTCDARYVDQEARQLGAASPAQGTVLKMLPLKRRWHAIQADVNEPVVG